MEPAPLSSCRRVLILLILSVIGLPSYIEAQSFKPDTVRFLEQSTFGPTYDLIAHTEEVGFEAFLAEQAAAPMRDYPESAVLAADAAHNLHQRGTVHMPKR